MKDKLCSSLLFLGNVSYNTKGKKTTERKSIHSIHVLKCGWKRKREVRESGLDEYICSWCVLPSLLFSSPFLFILFFILLFPLFFVTYISFFPFSIQCNHHVVNVFYVSFSLHFVFSSSFSLSLQQIFHSLTTTIFSSFPFISAFCSCSLILSFPFIWYPTNHSRLLDANGSSVESYG